MTDDTTTIAAQIPDAPRPKAISPKVISIDDGRLLRQAKLRQRQQELRLSQERKRDPFAPGSAFGPPRPGARLPGPIPMHSWTVKGWTRTETLALAQQSCVYCLGMGQSESRAGTLTACGCVLRAIFGACFRRFQRCASEEGLRGQVTYERCGNHGNRGIKPLSGYSMKNEEFLADFALTAFRALNGGKTKSQLEAEGLAPSPDWRLFALHFLLGQDWRRCCLHLALDRGRFFHGVYRVMETLGSAFREVSPFALFPVDEYFSPGVRSHRAAGRTGAGWAPGRSPVQKVMAA